MIIAGKLVSSSDGAMIIDRKIISLKECILNVDAMKQPITISLIAPVYRVEKYIGKFADSVFSQSYPHIQFIFVNDGQSILLENIKVKTLFTPGHTNCSVVYIIDDLMFSGDTLFNMSVGRTDLATGNSVVQMNTLNMLKKMKIDYKIYPGHENSTTLFYERKYNPYMK